MNNGKIQVCLKAGFPLRMGGERVSGKGSEIRSVLFHEPFAIESRVEMCAERTAG